MLAEQCLYDWEEWRLSPQREQTTLLIDGSLWTGGIVWRVRWIPATDWWQFSILLTADSGMPQNASSSFFEGS